MPQANAKNSVFTIKLPSGRTNLLHKFLIYVPTHSRSVPSNAAIALHPSQPQNLHKL